MNVFELFATLSLDSSAYDEGLSNAQASAGSFGQSLSSGLGTAARVGAAAVAATTTAVVAGTAAFANGITEVAMYGDEIDKTSQRLGLSTTAFQEWDYVLNIAGTDMASMQMGMKTLTNQLDNARNGSAEAQAMFEQLGISMEDINTLSREEIFEQAIYGFQSMADSTERAALANDLFGRSGQQLTPLFNMTEEETRGLIETANEYGMVMSEDAVAASAAFRDSLTTLQGTMSGLRNNLMSDFLPSVTTVMSGLAAVFAGDESGMASIQEGVEAFTAQLDETLPRFLEIGGSILEVLADAVTRNLPTLIEAAGRVIEILGSALISNAPALISSTLRIIGQISMGLIQAAPQLLRASLEILQTLGTELVQNAPTIMSSLTEVIIEIVTMLTDPTNLEMMINLGLQLIVAIAQGLAEATPQLVAVIPDIIINIVTALVDSFPAIVQAASDLIYSLEYMVLDILTQGWTRMKNDATSQLTAIFAVIGGILDSIKTKFEEIWTNIQTAVSGKIDEVKANITGGIENARETVAGILDTIKQKFSDVFEGAKEIVSNAIDFIKGLFDFEWSLPDLALPHFTVEGGEAPWGFGGQGHLPTVSVDWYSKAMETPFLLTAPTIFGASGGGLLGGGEAGAELVYGRENLLEDIRNAVGSRQEIIQVFIGQEKVDEFMVNSDQRVNFISGGRG